MRLCLCARSACTPPLLAGVCGVGVCAWARVSAAPRHSWRGCWGVCVFLCALRLYLATRGSVVRCGCVCWGSGFGCALPLLVGVSGCVCACVRAPLVPCHSWLGCAVWVFVLGLGFRLRPATPGWGVGACVCLCAHSACVLHRVQLDLGDGVASAMGAFLGLSRGAPLWFRPGIGGSRFPGPPPGWLPLLRLGGGRPCYCLGRGALVGG